jgi:chromosomal replication initiation ATPase DnaA
MTREKFIAYQIKALLDVDVFEHTRKQSIVDARSMYCYILRKDFNYTLYEIRDVFRESGKPFDHSSVHHNVILFDEVQFRRKEMIEIRRIILQRLNPKYELLQIIEDIKEQKEIDQIINCIKSHR